jgi:hypothetical protein
MRTAEGETYDGTILLNQPPRSFSGIVPHLNDGVIRYEFEGGYAVMTLSLWGNWEREKEEFEERWSRRLSEIL